jgi:Asp-tRNA(Asn)/Glu-tRNA(Gln) amidotransferase A subunit family amidase
MTAIALGTDGGGSIRIPASFCGVVGHKPTFGLVPKEPGFEGWKTLSVDGPLARSVRDAALMLSVIAGPAAADDMTCPGPPNGSYLDAVTQHRDLGGLRLAWSADLGMLPVDLDVRAVFAEAVQVLAGLGYRTCRGRAGDRTSYTVVEHDCPCRGLLFRGPVPDIVTGADVARDRRDRRGWARHHRWPVRRCAP